MPTMEFNKSPLEIYFNLFLFLKRQVLDHPSHDQEVTHQVGNLHKTFYSSRILIHNISDAKAVELYVVWVFL